MDGRAEKLRERARVAQKRKEWRTRVLIVLLITCLIIVKFFIVDCIRVKGNSMAPTYQDGQFTIVAKCAYWFDEPQNGDVVILRHGSDNYIKRVTACPGEWPADSAPDSELPAGYYFVEGDNRSVSIDSRSFGPVSREVIIGKVIY